MCCGDLKSFSRAFGNLQTDRGGGIAIKEALKTNSLNSVS